MDVALKQRLVGATVLVIFGVIFIPMLLDGPPSGRIEVPIDIPEPPDQRFETRLLPVGQNGADPAPAAAADRNDEPVRPAETQSPVLRPNPDPPSRPLPRPTSEPAAAVNPSSTTTAPPRPAATGGGWQLQVGSFGNAANAARLVARLSEAGWDAYQEKIEVASNALYRVRVRGWPDKPAATEAGQSLLSAFPELDLSVRQVGGPPPAADAPLKGWMVQVGGFNSENNARALRDRLRGGGFSAHVMDLGAGQGARYRVRVGPALSEADAGRTRDRINQEFNIKGLVVDHP
ncbi:MAG: SPOR domain-containing protein [Pseudomonadota bacterium]